MMNASTTMHNNKKPHYTVKINGRWLPDMIGLEDSKGSSETYAGIFGQTIEDFILGDGYVYYVRNRKGEWIARDKYDLSVDLSKNAPITGIQIDGANVIYSVHVKGGSWLPSAVGGERVVTGMAIDGIWVDSI